MNINAPLSIRRRMGLEIFRRLENERTEEHQLKQLFWECTLRCNLHCRHCGSDCKKIAGHPDMPKEDFLRVLDSVSAQNDPHKIFVIITGGEPLMRKDLEECGRAIYERGFPWGMVTNGLYMTRERLNGLLDAGLHTATVSLDGFATDHNWMRGNPQSFERAVEAIKLMVQVPDFVFDVVTCVNKHSYMRLAWDTLLRARALENQCYVCGVNRVGIDGYHLKYNGGSKIYSALGEEAASVPDETEGIATATLHLTALHQFREKFPVWKDADEFQLRHS